MPRKSHRLMQNNNHLTVLYKNNGEIDELWLGTQANTGYVLGFEDLIDVLREYNYQISKKKEK